MFPKKAPKVQEMSVEDYRKMISSNPKMIPKKSILNPKSKTMKSVIPESSLQSAIDDLLVLRKMWSIRFDNWFMAWMRHQEPKYQKHFFGQVAGKLPDNLVMLELGCGLFLSAKIELKTEDIKGKAVGKLHGKQKRYAESEGWFIVRNVETAQAVLDRIESFAEKLRKIVDETIR